MTRNEILNLKPGPELDALVAETVMGWNYVHSDDCNGGYPSWVTKAGEVCKEVDSWNPSTDIAAGMQVKDRMNNLGWWWTLFCSPMGKPSAELWKRGELHRPNVMAEKLEEAICKASVLAIEEAKL